MIWAAVYDLPHVADPGKKIAWLPMLDYKFGKHTDAFREEGSVSLPVGYARLSEIHHVDPDDHANDVGSVIYFFQRGVLGGDGRPIPVAGFVAERMPDDLQSKATGATEISGRGLTPYFLDRMRLWPHDHPLNPTMNPDWIWGSDENRVRNPSAEDNPIAILNPGFEDGLRAPFMPGAVEGYSANASVQGAVVDTGSFALLVDPLIQEGGASVSFRIFPKKQYDVTARIRGASGVGYQIGCTGPTGIIPILGAFLATAFDGMYHPGYNHPHEAQKLFTGTGAFTTQTLAFIAADDITQLSVREGQVFNGANFYIDVVTVVGFGIGTEPWQASSGLLNVFGSDFQASQAVPPTDGAWVFKVIAPPGGGVFQGGMNGRPGETITFSADLRGPSAHLWALEVVDQRGSVVGQAPITLSGTMTQAEATIVLPSFLPGDGELAIWVVNRGTVTSTAYFDNVKVYPGFPKAPIGEILGMVFDHTQARGDLLWLTKTFTDTDDSDGNPWDKSRSMTLRAGDTLGQIVESIQRLWKYVIRIRFDREANEYFLDAFNPGRLEMEHDTTDSGMLMVGMNILGGELVSRNPEATHFRVNAESGAWISDIDGDLVAAWGEGDAFLEAATAGDDDIADVLTEAQARNQDQMVTFQAEMTAYGQVEPLKDVDIFHKVGVDLGDSSPIPRGERIITSVVASGKPGGKPDYQVYVNSDAFASTGAAGLAEAVRRLLRKAQHEKRPRLSSKDTTALGGGGGGAPTVVIAPSDSSDWSKARADFTLPGANDTLVIQQVIDQMETQGHGRILFTEGTIRASWDDVQSGAGGLMGSTTGMTLEGVGVGTGTSSHAGTVFDIVGTPTPGDVAFNFRGPGTRIQGIRIEDNRSGNTFDVTGNTFDVIGIVCESYATIIDVSGYVLHGTFVDCEGANSWIERMSVEYADIGVFIGASNFVTVRDNALSVNETGILVGADSDDIHILGNDIQAPAGGTKCVLLSDNNDRIIIADNHMLGVDGIVVAVSSHLEHIYRGNTIEATQYGIHLDGAGIIGCVIDGNALDMESASHGIFIDGGSLQAGVISNNSVRWAGGDGIRIAADLPEGRIIIDANFIELADQHGIHLMTGGSNGVSYCEITNNYIAHPGQDTDNTFDGIHIEDNSNNNFIHGNRIVAPTSGSQPRYGINIADAACDNNVYAGNWAGPTANFGTGPYNDAGTGSLNTFPAAGGAQGDNFVL